MGEAAAEAVAPEARAAGLSSFRAVFEAVAGGEAEAGVVPVEDTVAGSVGEALDLLFEFEAVRIVGERAEPVQEDGLRRFLVIAREGAAPSGLRLGSGPAKTSLVLVPNEAVPNALFRALTAFVGRRLGVLHVQSRPRPGRPGAYRYYVDVEGEAGAEPLSSALPDAAAMCDELRVLGSYPSRGLGP